MRNPVLTLLTDFGGSDAYAGVLKGVILSLAPRVQIVDLAHSVEPFAIHSASYLLASAWDFFPKGTVFLAVVDPGVGTEREALIAMAEGKLLIAPDNGLAGLLVRLKGGGFKAFRLKSEAVAARIGRTASRTFQGRDLFAPAAALCAAGKTGPLGRRLRGQPRAPAVLPGTFPSRDPEALRLTGLVLHADRFGNLISAIRREDLSAFPGRSLKGLRCGDCSLAGIKGTFGEAPPGEPLAYFGSSGFLEMAVREGSFAGRFGVKPGEGNVEISF